MQFKNIDLKDLCKTRETYPSKRTMNLLYKPDRTTKPATIALYVLFVLTLLLGLAKLMIYDLWAEVQQERQTLANLSAQIEAAEQELADYDEVWEQYNRYAATDEERAIIDRIEVLTLLDAAIGSNARLSSLSINGDTMQVQFYAGSLAQTAQIVSRLEASPLVASTEVNTAATQEQTGTQVMASVYIQLQKEGAENE